MVMKANQRVGKLQSSGSPYATVEIRRLLKLSRSSVLTGVPSSSLSVVRRTIVVSNLGIFWVFLEVLPFLQQHSPFYNAPSSCHSIFSFIQSISSFTSFVVMKNSWFVHFQCIGGVTLPHTLNCLIHGRARVAHCVTARWRNFSHYCRPLRQYDVWFTCSEHREALPGAPTAHGVHKQEFTVQGGSI